MEVKSENTNTNITNMNIATTTTTTSTTATTTATTTGTTTKHTKLTIDMINSYISIINKILINKRDIGSEIFKSPVPYIELGLIDYIDVVGVPMDLTFIKNKLEHTLHSIEKANSSSDINGGNTIMTSTTSTTATTANTTTANATNDIYLTPEHCVADMRQIWHNAMIYNTADSEVYAVALDLSIYYESELLHCYSGNDNSGTNGSNGSGILPPPTTLQIQDWNRNCRR